MRQQVREALQRETQVDEGEDLGVLTGYVVISQWSSGDGDGWLTWIAGDINDEMPPIWTVQGWLQHTMSTIDRDLNRPDEDDEEYEG